DEYVPGFTRITSSSSAASIAAWISVNWAPLPAGPTVRTPAEARGEIPIQARAARRKRWSGMTPPCPPLLLGKQDSRGSCCGGPGCPISTRPGTVVRRVPSRQKDAARSARDRHELRVRDRQRAAEALGGL